MISENLIQQINEFKDLLISASTLLVELKSENETLREKNNELYESLMNNDNSLSEVKDVESDLRHKLKATEYKVEQLESEIKSLNEELEDRELLVEELKQRDTELTALESELKEKVESLSNTNNQKDIIIEDLRNNHEYVKKALVTKQEEIFEKDKQMAEIVEKSAHLKNEIYHFKIKLENYPVLKEKAKEYDSLVESSKADEEQYLKNIEELKQLTYALESEHAREKELLNKEIEQKANAIVLLESKINEINNDKGSDNNNYDLQKEIEKLRSDLAQREKEVKELNEAGYGVLGQTLFGTMTFDNTDIKRDSQEMGELQEKLKKKDFRIDLLTTENSELKAQLDDIRAKNESMEALSKKRYQQIQEMEEKLNEVTNYKLDTKEKRLKLADSLEKYLHKIEKIIEN
jgi:chromosome segregation ATPase